MLKTVRRSRSRRLISLLLVFSLLVLLGACNGKQLSGTYSDNLGFSKIEFTGGNKVKYISLNGEQSGTYKMEGDNIKISYDDGKSDSFTYDEKSDTLIFAGGIFIFSKD